MNSINTTVRCSIYIGLSEELHGTDEKYFLMILLRIKRMKNSREEKKNVSSSSSFSFFLGSKIKNKTKSKSIWSRLFVWARCKNLLSTRNQKMFISFLRSSPLLMAFHQFFLFSVLVFWFHVASPRSTDQDKIWPSFSLKDCCGNGPLTMIGGGLGHEQKQKSSDRSIEFHCEKLHFTCINNVWAPEHLISLALSPWLQQVHNLYFGRLALFTPFNDHHRKLSVKSHAKGFG